MPGLFLRLDISPTLKIGPGKAALLEAIGQFGSISAAGRHLKMSYARAWKLVEELNAGLGQPVVSTASGGAHGGGAQLTQAGLAVLGAYRALQSECAAAAARAMARITDLNNPD